MTDIAGDLNGFTVQEAREKAAELLGSVYIEKVEDYIHSVPVCERCKTTVEPLISEEWFVKVDQLAKGAITIINADKIKFLPKNYKKILIDWLKNIHDWCISRSLWWGHRIPVWYRKKPLITKAILVHGVHAHALKNWFPNLKEALEVQGIKVEMPTLPNYDAPKLIEWTKTIESIGVDKGTLLIGHSLGGTLLMRLLDSGLKPGAVVIVSSNINKLGREYLDSFFAKPFGTYNVPARVIYSKDDDTVPINHLQDIAKRFKTEITIYDGYGHFRDDPDQIVLSETRKFINNLNMKVSDKSPGSEWIQDEQVLDTWFSSGLWPLSTLGWPEKTKEIDRYFPWDFEISAPEIKYLWIARMIMISNYITGKEPFKTMFFHAMLRDLQGRKFSKSLGNGIEPQYLIDKWGTDATRMALYSYSIPGRDGRVSKEILDERGKNFRNFATKMRNISRFILELKPKGTKSKLEFGHKDDRWIKAQLDKTIATVTKQLEETQLHLASEEIYEFIWHSFADVYLEKSKTRRADTQPVLEYILKNCLILLHPFMPFITEEIYQKFENKKKSIMLEEWPSI